MRPGYFVITPPDMGLARSRNPPSDEPMVWLDGLDIPLVQFLDASFAERLGERRASR